MAGTVTLSVLKEPTSSSDNITLNSDGSTTLSGLLTVSNSVSVANSLTITGISTVRSILETANVSATAATGTINIDALVADVLYFTANSTANCTVNLRANSSVTANSIMSVGQSLTVAFMMTNNATPFVANAFSIDGSAQTIKWLGGTAPTAGSASAVDMYVYTTIKTSTSPTSAVFASTVKYA